MATWGFIESSDASYANASAGTGTLVVTDRSFQAGQFTDGSQYACWIAYVEFDTSGVSTPPDALYMPLSSVIVDYPANSCTINVAAHDWGPTLDSSDWLDPAALSALTVIGSATPNALSNKLFVPIDFSGLTFGGTLRFVVFIEQQATATPPINFSNGYQQINSLYGYTKLLFKTNYVDPGSVASYATEVAADSPGLWWELDELSGTVAADSSGNGNDGQYVNSPTLGVPGLASTGTAVGLTNVGNSHIAGTTDFGSSDWSATGLTLEGIFTAPDVTDAVRYFPVVGFEGVDEIDIETDAVDNLSGDAFFSVYNSFGNANYAVNGFVFPNTITHIVATLSSDELVNSVRLYVNGDEYRSIHVTDASDNPKIYPLILGAGPTKFYGGGDGYSPGGSPPYADGSTDSMTGTLDEVAFYATELSRSRVLAHFKAMGSGPSGPPPVVSSVFPVSGPTTGGTSVAITGTNFTGVTSVKFGTTSASFVFNSDTSITATSPAHSAGVVDIRVTTASGGASATGSADHFTYAAPVTPAVTYVSPSLISTVGGTSILVVGTGLSGVTAVSFGGTPATSFTSISSTQLHAVAPAHGVGSVDLTVTTPTGTSPTGVADQIIYVTPTSPTPITITRWVLFDPSDSSTATLEINPSEGDEVSLDRTIASKSRRAFGNKTNIVTNSAGKREFQFSGTILTQAQYDLYTAWFNKTNPIEITDDLGRTYTVYITKYEPKRVRKTYVPWFHTYTVTGIIL